MRKNAFILVETIAVISVFVSLSLLIGDLLISSYKMREKAKKRYVLDCQKHNFIILLYTDDIYITSENLNRSYIQKISNTSPTKEQNMTEKFDVVWKK